MNDYRPYAYSSWQITNWVWTLGEILNRGSLNFEVSVIVAVVTIGFFACLLTMPNLVLPRRIATPQRVKQELESIDRG